jgi:hypothetical protein
MNAINLRRMPLLEGTRCQKECPTCLSESIVKKNPGVVRGIRTPTTSYLSEYDPGFTALYSTLAPNHRKPIEHVVKRTSETANNFQDGIQIN